MSPNDVMVPGHPRWDSFIEALSRSLICSRTTDNARAILASMKGIDVDKSLAALRARNGRCDCEIVFEVAALDSSRV